MNASVQKNAVISLEVSGVLIVRNVSLKKNVAILKLIPITNRSRNGLAVPSIDAVTLVMIMPLILQEE